MDQFLIGHPYFVAFFSIFLTLAGKKVWEVWLSKSSRITPDKCGDMQKICREQMLMEFYKFKHDVNTLHGSQNLKFTLGDENFKNLDIRLERTNGLLKALLLVQMEFCKTSPGVDCEDLNKILIDQGIEASSLNFRKRGVGSWNE
jgi:hypothetical protein